jgi:hypothetical protein
MDASTENSLGSGELFSFVVHLISDLQFFEILWP